MRANTAVSVAAVVLLGGLAAGCAGPGCSTSTDPSTCANAEGVNNYNRARQLGEAPAAPQYPDQYQMQDRAGRGYYMNPYAPGYNAYYP